MYSSEEQIADRNMKIIARALLDAINIFCHIHGSENAYIRELGRDMNNKYSLELEAIAGIVDDYDFDCGAE